MTISAPLPFSLRQLQYAVAVADTLSFRKAAERCHVSQPALSAQLAQMEDLLGVRLFERDRRRVLPTPAGTELVERARRVLQEAGELVDAAAGAADRLSGELRAGVIPTLAPYLLPAVAPALRRAHPRLSLRWAEDRMDRLVRDLHAGALDAALVAEEADLGDLEREVVSIDRFVLATPRDHPLGLRTGPATAEDLEDADVLLLDEGRCRCEQVLALLGRARPLELEFRATSLPTLVQMVAGGAGVTLLPEIALATESARSALRVREFREPAPRRTIVLAWRRRSPLGPALRGMAQTIRAAYPAPAARGLRARTAGAATRRRSDSSRDISPSMRWSTK